MTVFTRCKDLIAYSLQITNNTNRFPKKIRFTITNRLQDMVLKMYENLLMANEIFPIDQEDIRERKRYQRKTLAISKQVLFLVELSLEQGRIEPNSASYWSGLVEEIQKLTAKWM
ncbi:four helix bundle protein [Sporosarcina contaminans]|uniref:Four helix bundle protein n=1 Tax=Sporosarcina contaminans TaxID=633403 RepID=A0ABW3TTA2_9BACL